MLKWDPTVNLGTVISIVLFLGCFVKVVQILDKLQFRVDQMWDWYLINIERRVIKPNVSDKG